MRNVFLITLMFFAGCASTPAPQEASVTTQSVPAAATISHPNPRIEQVLRTLTPQAADDFQRKCEEGNKSACNIMGIAYEFGTARSVRQNDQYAFYYYGIACENGHSLACNSAVRVHVASEDEDFKSTSVKHSYFYAATGCEQDHFLSCSHFSEISFLLGQVAKQEGDIKECRKFLSAAYFTMRSACFDVKDEEEVVLCEAWRNMPLECE